MGLNVYLNTKVWISYDNGITSKCEDEEVYSGGTTHNLTEMEDKAGIYEAIWRPYRLRNDYPGFDDNDYKSEYEWESKQIITGQEIVDTLEKGLIKLKSDRKYFEQFNSSNGWGMYEHFVPFIESYLNACKEYPGAIVQVDR